MARQAQAAQSRGEGVLNGVDVTQLMDNIREIRKNSKLADFKFRVRNRWVDGGLNRAKVEGFYGTSQEIGHQTSFMFDIDEPPVLLGYDRGANPVEILLAALSGCMTTTLAYHSAAQGIEVSEIESEYEGDIDMHGFLDLDPKVRKGYREIRVKFKVKSDADKAKIEELVKKSPVYDVVTNPTPVRITVEKS